MPDATPPRIHRTAEQLAEAHAGHDEIAAALAGREGVMMP